MCIYVCEYGVRTPVCVGMHAGVCVRFQKPEEDTECPVLSFFAVFFLSAPVILLFPLSLLLVMTPSLKIGL